MAVDSSGKITVTQGEKVTHTDFNTLFTKLEEVRKKHKAAGGVSSAQQTALDTAYVSPTAVGAKVQKTDVEALKTKITNLENSPYLSGFSSKITIPNVGDLLSVSLMNTVITNVEDIEKVCANCAHYTSAGSQGNFNSDFGSAANKGNFGSNENNGNFSSNYSSNFSSNYSSNYSSNANKGNFSSNYSSNFSANYSSNYSSNASKGNFSSYYSNTTSSKFNKCSGSNHLYMVA